MRFNSNTAFIVVGILFILTVWFRNDLENHKVDTSLFHIDTNNTKEYLLNEEFIVFFNKDKNIISKVNFYNSPKKELFQDSETIIIDSSKYNKKLDNLKCKSSNVLSCIEKNLTSNYMIKEGNKFYIVNKNFGMKVFDIIAK